MFRLGLEPIRNSNNTYLKDMLFKEKEEVFSGYSRRQFPMGFVRDYYNKDRDMKKLFTIDISQAFRMLLLASTRTGKSFTIRGMIDRMKKCGMSVCILSDVKNEYYSSKNPVQQKFRNKLIKGEIAEGIPMKVFRPTFFQYLEGNASRLPEGQEWCSIDLSLLQPRDFVTMMDFLGLTKIQKDSMERALYEAKQAGFEIKVWDDFRTLIENSEFIQGKAQILNRLYKINFYNPFDANHRIKPSNYMADGYTTDLNLQYFNSLEKNNGFLQVTIASWLRDIIDARKEKKIPPVMFVVDECARIVPAVGDTVAKYEILESIDTDTAYDVNFCLKHDTLIQTNNGNKKISDLDDNNDKIVSWNFKINKRIKTKFIKRKPEIKKTFKIQLENGTFVEATKEHKFFVKLENGSIIEKTVDKLKINDEILTELRNCEKCGKLTSNKKYCSKKCAFSDRNGIKNSNYNNKWSNDKKKQQSEKIKKWRKDNPDKAKQLDEKCRKIKQNMPEEDREIQRQKVLKYFRENPERAYEFCRKNSDHNKGKKFSEEHRYKIGQSNIGKHTISEENKIKMAIAVKKYWSEISLEDFLIRSKSISRKSKLRMKNPTEGQLKVQEKFKTMHLNKKMSIETINKISKSRRGIKLKQSTKEKLRESTKRIFKNVTDKEMKERCRKAYLKTSKSPNELEKYCMNIFKDIDVPLKFVGDGKIWINRGNPDFIDEENKIIVEVYCDYFKIKTHQSVEKYKEKRIKQFEGWKVFFFDESQVKSEYFKSMVDDIYA